MKHYGKNQAPKTLWRNPWHFIAFGFGSGAIPFAPGTAGSISAIPIYLLLQQFSLPIYLLLVMILAIGAIWLSDKVSKDIGIHDHPGINLDEFVGYLVTMTATPLHWWWILLGLVLFRFFDIYKPFPISWLDRHIPGGLGMVVDDIAAGILSMLVLQLIIRIHVF